MNETKQSTPCTCPICPGAACTCGCETVAAQAVTQAACVCGPQCQCGQAGNGAKS